MLSVMLAVIGFLAAMVPLVVIHEFGHYWVAKRLGVKILRFSVGFGRPLWLRRCGRDQTEWVIAAIPLGGYVRMLDEQEAPVAPEERDRAFNRQPIWKRTLIVLAGPLANLLLAFALYTGMLMVGIPQLQSYISTVQPESLAAKAGFRAGERIVSVGGKPVESWSEFDLTLLPYALGQDKVLIGVRRADGAESTRELDFSDYERKKIGQNLAGKLGLSAMPRIQEPLVGGVGVDRPAARAGLKAGDRILSINGARVESWDDMSALIQSQPGKTLRLEIQRDSRRLNLTAVSESEERDGKTVGVLGIAPSIDEARFKRLIFTQRLGFLEAAERTWDQGGMASRLTLEMMWRMLAGQVSSDNLSGPIGIASMAGESLSSGWQTFLGFLVIMSLSLGLLNLLPIPVLDGGHLMYYLAEAIMRRPLSERTLMLGQRLGLAFLVLLTFLAFYNDLHRLLLQHG